MAGVEAMRIFTWFSHYLLKRGRLDRPVVIGLPPRMLGGKLAGVDYRMVSDLDALVTAAMEDSSRCSLQVPHRASRDFTANHGQLRQGWNHAAHRRSDKRALGGGGIHCSSV